MSRKLSIPANLELREESVAKLSGAGVSPALAITSRANQALETLADGGLLLTSDQVSIVEQNFGKPIRNTQDVVRASEPRAGRKNGQLAIEVTLDPAYEEPLQRRAEATGLTIDEQLREVYHIAFANNWLYSLDPTGVSHFADPETQAYFRERLGEGFNLREVMKSHKELERSTKKTKSALRETEEATA